MKSAVPLLVLTAAIATSVASVLTATPVPMPATGAPPASGAPLAAASAGAPVLLARGDDEDRGLYRRDEHHERHDDDDDDEEDDDDYSSRGCGAGAPVCATAIDPAPAGNAAPPANGLFVPGGKPAVQVN